MNSFETTWKYLASAILLDIKDENRFKKLKGFHSSYKITEGRKISLIISMAPIIEGGLRAYLTLKVISVRNNNQIFNEIVENYSDRKKESGSDFSMLKPIEYYKKGIQEFNSIIERFDKTTQLPQIDKKEWRDLKRIFKTIHDCNISDVFNRVDKDLARDIEYIFHFRNFLVHSNLIALKRVDDSDTEYQGKAKMLTEFLEEKKLSLSKKEGEYPFFIEELLPDKLVFYFRDTLIKFLKVKEFNELPSMKNEINQIYR